MIKNIETSLPIAAIDRSGAARRMMAIMSVACSLAACSHLVGGKTQQMSAADTGVSDNFLPQPDLLVPGGANQVNLRYMSPDTSLSSYNSILIDPVVILSDSSSALSSANTEQRTTLANTYYDALYKALAAHCTLVSEPQPHALRFQAALSDAKSSNAVVKTVANYTPYVGVAYKIGSTVFNGGVGIFSGNATSEAYATDSVTGALVWQGVDKRGGGVAVVQNTTSDWKDVNDIFTAWGAQLVSKLQAEGVCTN